MNWVNDILGDATQDSNLRAEDEKNITGVWRFKKDSHTLAIRWDRQDQDESHQEVVEYQLSNMAGDSAKRIQSSHSYGDLSVAYWTGGDTGGGVPIVYQYHNVPYQTYYRMWNLTPNISNYIYYTLTQQHRRRGNTSADFHSVCPYSYDKIGNYYPQNA